MAIYIRKRFTQVSLRVLIGGTLLLTLPVAFIAHEAKVVESRAGWIEANYRDVRMFWARTNGIVHAGDKKNGPSWLRRRLGDMFLDSVIVDEGPELDLRLQIAIELFPEADIYVGQIYRRSDGVGAIQRGRAS